MKKTLRVLGEFTLTSAVMAVFLTLLFLSDDLRMRLIYATCTGVVFAIGGGIISWELEGR